MPDHGLGPIERHPFDPERTRTRTHGGDPAPEPLADRSPHDGTITDDPTLNRAWTASKAARILAQYEPPRPGNRRQSWHGTPSGYQYHGCRCDKCCEANYMKGRGYRARRRVGAVGRPPNRGVP